MTKWLIYITVLIGASCESERSGVDTQFEDLSERKVEQQFIYLTDDTTRYPKQIIGTGVIARNVDGVIWDKHVNLFSSDDDTRFIRGKIWPGDSVYILEKGETYWRVEDKTDSNNNGYLMSGWVDEFNKIK